MFAAGVLLAWYVFYQPIANVAVQLPASPSALQGPDAERVRALEDQNEKQKAANRQIEEQIALLKERLKGDVCTAKDPLGKNPPAPSNAAAAEPPRTEPPPPRTEPPRTEPPRTEPPRTGAPSAETAGSIRVFDMMAPGERRTVTPDWASIKA
jgi:hypothetical protein